MMKAAVGDRLMRTAAERRRAAVRRHGICARHAGDVLLRAAENDPRSAFIDLMTSRIRAPTFGLRVDDQRVKVAAEAGFALRTRADRDRAALEGRPALAKGP